MGLARLLWKLAQTQPVEQIPLMSERNMKKTSSCDIAINLQTWTDDPESRSTPTLG